VEVEPVSGSYPNSFRCGVCQTSREVKARNLPGCTSRRWRAARDVPPGSPAVAGSPPSQGSRRSPCLYSSPLDAARSKDGAGPRRLCFARWPLAQLPSPAWARSPVGPPERRAEAGCPSPVDTVEAASAARFVPPVFSSSFFGGARVFSSSFRSCSCL